MSLQRTVSPPFFINVTNYSYYSLFGQSSMLETYTPINFVGEASINFLV